MIWSSILPSFLASMVEFVEALTIVLVVGVTINWKSSLLGAAAATLILAVLVAICGTALVLYIPLNVLRIVVGIVLVLFGLQWLKKAVLRFSGLKAVHDEAAIYEEEMSEIRARGGEISKKFNTFGFVTALKSVLLEGLEVAFIVITFGMNISDTNKFHGIGLASLGAAMAFAVVLILGLILRKPLTKVPENQLKYVVGIMLTSFGVFWAGEGMKLTWPLGDWFILILIAFFLLLTWVMVRWLKPYTNKPRGKKAESAKSKPVLIVKTLQEIFDFFCGDWRIFWCMVVTLLLVATANWLGLSTALQITAQIVMLIGVPFSLYLALQKETR